MSSGLELNTLVIDGVEYTKEDLQGSNSSASFQSITIVNGLNLTQYEIYNYNPDWTYRVFLGGVGSLSLISQTNPLYDYEIKDGYFYLYSYDTEGPQAFLIVGVS